MLKIPKKQSEAVAGKSRDRQYNSHKKMNKKTNNDLQYTTNKYKEPNKNRRENSGDPEDRQILLHVWHPSCYIYQKCYRKGSIVTTTHVAYR
jgi:hypothetical protein